MRTFFLISLASISLVGGTTTSYATPITPPPSIQTSSVNPVTKPYADASLAPTQVREAFATAAKTHRRVLLDFGGNWCPDCRMLAGVFALPDVALWLEKNFVIVPVNVERFNANMDIAQQYGVTIKAVPTVLILTAEGRLLNNDGILALGNARRMSPQAAVDLLAQWAMRP